MRSSSFASAVLAGALLLTPVVAGYASASAQDFSITNPAEPADASRRDLMRQLQAWWDAHAYYPRHAASSDEGGTVKVHLLIYPDGRIWKVDMVQSSGSSSVDAAGLAAFRNGFVRPFPAGAANAELDLSLHYVLAHRHDQPVPAGYTATPSRRGFTITNDPVTSPVIETMLQRTCTGKVVKEGIRNHPFYGTPYWAQAVFFRKPEDGTPWVKFYEGGFMIIAPVTQIGRSVEWTGREERIKGGVSWNYHYTVWAEGENTLVGNIDVDYANFQNTINHGGTVDFACETETVPAITWNAMFVQKVQHPPSDPP